MKSKPCIYKLYHEKQPEQFYIGQTKYFSTRLSQHINLLKSGSHYSKRLQRIINKFGIDGLRIEAIEYCDPKLLNERETYYLKSLEPLLNVYINDPFGGGHRWDDKHKEKLKGRAKNINGRKGANKGIMPSNLKFIQTDPHIKNKVRQKLLGRKAKPGEYLSRSRKIFQYSLSGERLAEYNSITEAASITGISHTTIVLQALGKRKSGGGFVWSYKAIESGVSKSKHVH